RMLGHFEGDAQGYRPELAEVEGRDPIPRYEATLRADGVLDDAAVDRIRASATDRVEDAIAFAKDSAVPDPADVTAYVFA
ncbi:MAG: thiamine pyrophosphate-dependent enzyme, partial [Jiangellaceae bacterium]